MSSITPQDFEEYKQLVGQGMSQRTACTILDVPRTSMQNYIKRHLEDNPPKIQGRKADYAIVDECIESNKPKIIHYDLETTLAKSYHFNYWKTNIGVKQMIEPSHMLSHAWAWGDGEVVGDVLTREEVLAHDDERLVLQAWQLLDECDILVAHNGKRFDVKKVNGYFLKYGLPPPSPFKVLDTLEIAKKHFNLPFKSLEYLAKFLNVELKLDAGGIETWVGCDKGDQKALDTMMEYNLGDVVTLREIYKRLISWDNNGVNFSLYNDEHDFVCTHCGSDDILVMSDKFAYTPQRKYQVYRCNSCQAVLRSNSKEGLGNKLVKVVS